MNGSDPLTTWIEAKLTGRFRLYVRETPSGPFLPRSFYWTEEAAFDAGLLAVTGQTDYALESKAGMDFIIRDAHTRGRG